MSVIVVELIGDPVPKARARTRRDGKFYTPQKTVDFERSLAWAAKSAFKRQYPLTGPLAMRVTATLRIPKSFTGQEREAAIAGLLAPYSKPDLDNLVKAAKDALNGIVYKDDAQVCEEISRKEYGEVPKIRIEIAQLEPEHAVEAFRELEDKSLEPMIGKAA